MKNKDQGHPKVFELRPILVVSPSLAETLRACLLQAALSRISGVESFVLGNPKAWLGTAYHEVLERLWTSTEPNLSDEQLIEYLWSSAIATSALSHNNLRIKRFKFVPRVFYRELPIYTSLLTIAG